MINYNNYKSDPFNEHFNQVLSYINNMGQATNKMPTTMLPTINKPQTNSIIPNVLSNKKPNNIAGTVGINTEILKNGFSINNVLSNVSNFAKNNWANLGAAAFDAITYDQDKDINSVDLGVKNARRLIETGLMSSGNPITMGIGLGMRVLDQAGGFSDASKGLGGLTDLGNAAATFMAPLGFILPETQEQEESQRVQQSGSYGNMYKTDSYKIGKDNSKGKFLFGSSKANSIIEEENRRTNLADLLLSETDEHKDAVSGTLQLNELKRLGRYNNLSGLMQGPSAVRAGKHGGVLEKSGVFDFVVPDDITFLKNGGNIIPEGALHARKHNLEKKDKSLKGAITTKGIPVITKEEGGKVVQQAEIEHSEIIFNLDTTEWLEDKLEEWQKAQTKKEKEQIEEEVGKRLVYEILENTEDKTNLIESIK